MDDGAPRRGEQPCAMPTVRKIPRQESGSMSDTPAVTLEFLA